MNPTKKFSSNSTIRLSRAIERIRALEDSQAAARAVDVRGALLEDPLVVARAANQLAARLEDLAACAESSPSWEQRMDFLFEADGAVFVTDDPAEIAAVAAAKELIRNSIASN